MPSLSPASKASLEEYIAANNTAPFPGLILHITSAQNTPLFTSATPPHKPNTLLAIHSLSKLIGAIAYLQLCDRGLAALDDPAVIQKLLPELWAKKVLVGSKEGPDGEREWIFEDRKADITPRMLLNHTNGTANSFFNADLKAYLGADAATTLNEGMEYFAALRASPLLWQPGSKTVYGQGLDWLSILIERITGQALEDVLRENVWAPLGIEKAGFRGEWGGSVVAGEGVDFWPAKVDFGFGWMDLPGFAMSKVDRGDAWPRGETHVQSVASGLVMGLEDVARVFAVLLPQNGGVDPVTGTRILSAASAAEFYNTAHHAEAIRNDHRETNAGPPLFLPYDIQAKDVDPEGCFGLGTAIQGADRVLADGKRGRSKGTLWWLGAANLAFWIDGEKGIVVVMAANYFPFMDPKWVDFVAGVEGLIYEGLE